MELSDKFTRVTGSRNYRDPDRRTVAQRLRNIYEATPDEVKEAGMNWYGQVHDAVGKSGLGLTRGAGIVAAVSPNMDFENNNIHALREVQEMKPEHWYLIRHAAGRKGGRTDIAAMLQEVAPGMSAAPTPNLLKAHAILNGAHPDDVLPAKTAPKTNSFFHNIHDPSDDRYATVDGRQADTITDVMRPWSDETRNPHGEKLTSDRGISSSQSTRGVTRHDQYVGHVKTAAKSLGIRPNQLQAVTWLHGQNIERGFDPTRKQGDARRGQSYQHRLKQQEQLMEFHSARGAG